MERISRAEIESSVDSFPDLDYKFEHIDWEDIMEAEDASNPELKLDVLQQKSYSLRSDIFRSTVIQTGLPSLNSLKLDDHSRGLPPLDTKQLRGVNNGSVPKLVSFSGVLNKHKAENNNTTTSSNQLSANKTPVWRKKELFKIPALPIQMGKRSLEDSAHSHTERKAVRLPPSPSSLHDNKRLKISEHCYNRQWKYGDEDFIFTSDLDWRSNRAESRLAVPHSPSVSTLESDTELETGSAYSDTSSTSTLTSKRAKRREELPLVTDPHRLEQRQRQLDYGKNTDGYRNYSRLWPKFSRRPDMPRTPDKTIGYSHRRWLGLMTKWRKALHKWDEPTPEPKPKEFLNHIEDANIFPTLPQDEVAPGTNSVDKAHTQFFYSLVFQNLWEDNDQPPQQQPDKQTSISSTNAPVAVVTEEVPTVTKPLTYSSVLKAPVSVHTVETPRELESHSEENKQVPTVVSNTEILKEKETKDAPPPDTSQPVDAPTNITFQSPPSDAIGSGVKHKSCVDDSMEVDMLSHSTKEALNDKLKAQPLSYSQALKSKPSVNLTTMDTNTVETVNELSNDCKEMEKSGTEMKSDENPKSGLTYSQVLANAMLNGPSQETQISNQIQENTGYKS